MITGLRAYLGLALFKIAKEYEAEVKSHMLTPEGRESVEDVNPADVKIVADVLTVMVIGGPDAVMDNYGTGSLMDRNNPALRWYMYESGLWNPQRMGLEIAGRPKGWYTNIYGERQFSSGRAEGQVVEGMQLKNGETIEPMPPSRAFETAMKWLVNGRIQKRIMEAISSFPFHAYLKVYP
jgi:hypothetical protein